MITTYGVQVPSGFFLPGMIVGCAIGQFYGDVVGAFFTDLDLQQSYTLVGAGAMLAGYSRLTYSLAVVMLETTQSINLFIPMIFAILVSHSVGGLFTDSLYKRAIKSKDIPLLDDKASHAHQFVRAEEIMSKPVVTLQVVC
jgi:H+/Cl- antiporter ClcA